MLFRNLVVMGAIGLTLGCSSDPGKVGEPVPVSGTITLPGGKIASNLTLEFSPTTSANNGASTTIAADGKFETKLAPGKYMYFIGGKGNLKDVPENLKTRSTDRTVTVPKGGGTIEIPTGN